jgi:ketoreductase RED2
MVERPVVLVTGSTSGIGEATARRFAAEGYHVVVNSSKSVSAGEALEAELPHATYLQGAVSGDMEAEAFVERVVAETGRLDVLVNNAGVTKQIPHTDLASATVDVFREIFEVNVFGTWALSVAAMPALKESRGAIVNVSSIAGLRQTGSSIPYATSKAALNHLTTLLAKVVGPEVRVNAVCPGLIDTPWTADWDVIRQFVSALAPLKRSGQPDDVSGVIYALATLPYLTGQVLAVDGGLTLTQ